MSGGRDDLKRLDYEGDTHTAASCHVPFITVAIWVITGLLAAGIYLLCYRYRGRGLPAEVYLAGPGDLAHPLERLVHDVAGDLELIDPETGERVVGY